MNLNKGLKPVALLCSSALHLLANAQDIDAEIEISLPVVEVQAESLQQRVYTREQMDATPQSNRDLAGLIADNPAIRSANENSGAGNKGSLAPESFSIHGESPYQNQFQIDGINATNIINPHKSPQTGQGPNTLNSYSQSYNVDTDLLDEVEVYDNRVPVEFGGFTGGVVNSKIKKPTGNGVWKLKRSFNSSSLTEQNIGKISSSNFSTDFENGKEGFSSEWKKNFSSLSGDFSLVEGINGLISFSRRQSEVARVQSVVDPSVQSLVKKTDLRSVRTINSDSVDNFLAKINANIDGANIGVSFKYAERVEEMVRNTSAMGGLGWDYGQKSYGLGFDYDLPTTLGNLSLKLGYDRMSSSKEDEETDLFTEIIHRNNGGGTYIHGGYGDVAEVQDQYSLKARYDWRNFRISNIDYKIYAGIDYQNVEVFFDRAQDVNVYTYSRSAAGARTLTVHHLYTAGVAKASQEKIGAYWAGVAAWRNLSLSLAARLDRDDLLKRSNIAPRIGFDWDVDGVGNNKFGIGWSRYYGMDVLGYALEKEKSALRKNIKPTTQPAAQIHDFSGLKTPYSDEWAFSFSKRLNAYLLTKIQYVNRSSRDGITLEEFKIKNESVPDGHRYMNNGRSNNKTFMIGLHAAKGIGFAGAKWSGGIDFSWQDTKRNSDARDSWESALIEGESEIYVNDVVIKSKDKPQLDQVFPRKVNVSWVADWDNGAIVWGNKLNWNSSRDRLIYSGLKDWLKPSTNKIVSLSDYHVKKMPSYWSWDMLFTYKPKFLKGAGLTVEVLNVLNQSRQTKGIYNISDGSVRIGREIWLNASYEF